MLAAVAQHARRIIIHTISDRIGRAATKSGIRRTIIIELGEVSGVGRVHIARDRTWALVSQLSPQVVGNLVPIDIAYVRVQ